MATITHTATARQACKSLKTLDYLEVSRNLRNSPIARGARAHVEWVINKREGWRGYSIPGAGVFLPINCGIERHATGFDVAVLLTLTGLALSRGPSEVRISNTDILRHWVAKAQRAQPGPGSLMRSVLAACHYHLGTLVHSEP